MLDFCEMIPVVFSEWGLCPRLEGVEQSANSAPYGGVSVSSILALNLTSQHHKQRVICQAYSPVLEDGTNTFFQLDVRCESVNGSFNSSLPFLATLSVIRNHAMFQLFIIIIHAGLRYIFFLLQI